MAGLRHKLNQVQTPLWNALQDNNILRSYIVVLVNIIFMQKKKKKKKK